MGDPVVAVDGQSGGMSPGCAARLRTRSGTRGFVKAVGSDLNPDTPGLYRSEIRVLSRLTSAPHRPRVIGTYDDGDWVALLLEDVDGRHPDLDDDVDTDAVWATVTRQAVELTPAPDGLELRTFDQVIERWLQRWRHVADDPASYLPAWALGRLDDLDARVRALPGQAPTTSLCHWDLRSDNILIRPDGTVVLLDWGMALRGPMWADQFFLALNWVETPSFDAWVRRIVPAPDDDLVTALLVLFGGAQAWNATQVRPGLPTMPEYCRSESARLLAGARRRLGWPPGRQGRARATSSR